jgi:hypothetical protein
MERGNFSGNGTRGSNAQRFGGMASSYGGGQGSMFGHSGTPANNGFHPGHARRVPYSRGGGGRYGGREHPGAGNLTIAWTLGVVRSWWVDMVGMAHPEI